MKIIVSFTSYPPRINSVHKVVESLYRQTVLANEIILYLSLDEFPKEEEDVPETLRRLIGHRGFRIEWVQGNLKSHKKYYYALQKYTDAVVITVDDDKIYAETMISDLIKGYERFPNAVSARIIRIMLKKSPETLESYNRWEKEKYLEEYTDEPRMDLCAIGAGGICYSPSLGYDDLFNVNTILEVAGDYDDLWLKYNEMINNIPVVYTKPSQKDITIDNSQVCRLAANNLYGNGNDKCIDKLFEMLKVRDANCYQKLFQNLMTWEEYITKKKSYYSNVYGAVFDGLGKIPIYIYGAGKMTQYILMILTDLGLKQRIAAIIVSDKLGNPSDLYGLQVRSLSEINRNKELGVILGVRNENRKAVLDGLTGYHYHNIELDWHIIALYYPIERFYYKMMSTRYMNQQI